MSAYLLQLDETLLHFDICAIAIYNQTFMV